MTEGGGGLPGARTGRPSRRKKEKRKKGGRLFSLAFLLPAAPSPGAPTPGEHGHQNVLHRPGKPAGVVAGGSGPRVAGPARPPGRLGRYFRPPLRELAFFFSP